MSIAAGAGIVKEAIAMLLGRPGVAGNAFRRHAALTAPGAGGNGPFAAQLSPLLAQQSAPVVGEATAKGTIFGDLNGDRVVDESDLSALRAAFATGDTTADLNLDGRVDTADLGLLLEALTSGVRTPQPAIVGDLNADGSLDNADLDALVGAFGSTDTTKDLNGDGRVDTADLGLLAMLIQNSGARREAVGLAPLPAANSEPRTALYVNERRPGLLGG